MFKIKICGITMKEQALKIADMGADALGFVFFKGSKRYVSPVMAKMIVDELPEGVKVVGVFVNPNLEDIVKIQQEVGLDIIQLHGDETPEFCAELTDAGIKWLKAFRVGDDFDFSIMADYPAESFMLDAWSDKEYGGSGNTLDWEMVQIVSRKKKIILAGGLTPGNLERALETAEPYGIDVSSGVETSPGIKDLDKVKDLIDTYKAFDA